MQVVIKVYFLLATKKQYSIQTNPIKLEWLPYLTNVVCFHSWNLYVEFLAGLRVWASSRVLYIIVYIYNKCEKIFSVAVARVVSD